MIFQPVRPKNKIEIPSKITLAGHEFEQDEVIPKEVLELLRGVTDMMSSRGGEKMQAELFLDYEAYHHLGSPTVGQVLRLTLEKVDKT